VMSSGFDKTFEQVRDYLLALDQDDLVSMMTNGGMAWAMVGMSLQAKRGWDDLAETLAGDLAAPETAILLDPTRAAATAATRAFNRAVMVVYAALKERDEIWPASDDPERCPFCGEKHGIETDAEIDLLKAMADKLAEHNS
jgi:hypothetical protein